MAHKKPTFRQNDQMQPFRTARAVDVLNGFGEGAETQQVDFSENEASEVEKTKSFSGEDLEEVDVMKAFREQKWGTILSWAAFSPEAVGRFQGVHMKTGVSALHYGILFNAPVDVVGSLIYASPELTRRRAKDRIATEAPVGDLPIHWAARVGSSVEVFKCLLDADPLCGFVGTGDVSTGNESAMSMLWNRHNDGIVEASLLWNREAESFSSHMERTQSSRSRPWTKMMMLLQYGYNAINHTPTTQRRHVDSDNCENDASQEVLPLHAIASLCDEASLLPFVEFLLEVDPLWIKSSDKPNGGITPLAAAAKSTRNRHVRQALLKMLLSRWPDGAHRRDADKGRLPLTWAASAGVGVGDDNYSAWVEGGLEELFLANPEAVSEKDRVSGLYPFMLAALRPSDPVGDVQRATHPNKPCTPMDLTAAYKLLLADPSCLPAC